MTYLTVRLDESGELGSMNLNDSQVNGQTCAVCAGNDGSLVRIGRLVNGPRIYSCARCVPLLRSKAARFLPTYREL